MISPRFRLRVAMTPRPAILETPTSQAGSLSLNGARCRSSSSDVRFGQIIFTTNGNTRKLLVPLGRQSTTITIYEETKKKKNSFLKPEPDRKKSHKEELQFRDFYFKFSQSLDPRSCVFSLFTALVLLLFLFRFLLFFHWARISRLPFANCRRFPALHDFYVGKCRKMFRTKAENSLGISAAATKRCERRGGSASNKTRGCGRIWELLIMRRGMILIVTTIMIKLRGYTVRKNPVRTCSTNCFLSAKFNS